jgi:hypothetical protein
MNTQKAISQANKNTLFIINSGCTDTMFLFRMNPANFRIFTI